MNAADTMPKLALTMLSFASPAIKFESELVGVLFAGLIPTPGRKSTEEIVLMAVAELEAFIKAQFDDVAVREAWHQVATTYDWFKRTYESAKNDPEAVNRRSADVLGEIDEALGPNSFLELGIETVSDQRYRYLGLTTLSVGIGLKLTLWKLQMQAQNDRSSLPVMREEITAYQRRSCTRRWRRRRTRCSRWNKLAPLGRRRGISAKRSCSPSCIRGTTASGPRPLRCWTGPSSPTAAGRPPDGAGQVGDHWHRPTHWRPSACWWR